VFFEYSQEMPLTLSKSEEFQKDMQEQCSWHAVCIFFARISLLMLFSPSISQQH
jgi:hypothetical protein